MPQIRAFLSEASYPQSEAPYPGSEAPYPQSEASYPGSEAPCPQSEASYPGSEAPYPQSEASYPCKRNSVSGKRKFYLRKKAVYAND
ncbi:MAG: hypothetical protein LBB81_07210 [Treponema sp.]|nr:hypothetical protein [Treponema sp.]